MAMSRPTLTQLAQQTAAQIGFTARRWWRDSTDPNVLRVEVERRLVGAPPAVVELTVPISHTHTDVLPSHPENTATPPSRARRSTSSLRTATRTQQRGVRRT